MTILSIPVAKAKGMIEVDTDKIPDRVFQYAVQLGLKALIARGFSKFKAEDFKNETEARAEAMKIGQTNVEAIYGDKVRIVGQKAGEKRASKELTEAIRLAKVTVKNQMKALNIRAKDVKAADITKAAKAMVDANPDHYFAAARESLARAEVETASGIDLAKILGATPAPKTERKAPAKKGTGGIPGAVATKTKPAARPHA